MCLNIPRKQHYLSCLQAGCHLVGLDHYGVHLENHDLVEHSAKAADQPLSRAVGAHPAFADDNLEEDERTVVGSSKQRDNSLRGAGHAWATPDNSILTLVDKLVEQVAVCKP